MINIDNVLCNVRKTYFESGKEQKNKITKSIGNAVYKYSYHIKYGQPMRWKKMLGSRLIEKSDANSDGSYKIVSYKEHRDICKIAYFTKEHEWIKTEYFSELYCRKKPCLIIEPMQMEAGVKVQSVTDGKDECIITNMKRLDDNLVTTQLLNSSKPCVFCSTLDGDFFCYDNLDLVEDIGDETVDKQDIIDTREIIKEDQDINDIHNNECPEKHDKQQDLNGNFDNCNVIDLAEACNKILKKNSEKLSEDISKDDDHQDKTQDTDITAEHHGSKSSIEKTVLKNEGETYFYSGDVKNRLRDGFGRLSRENGRTVYEGMYSANKKDGFGVSYYNTGNICYVGNWKENKRDGLGVSFEPDDGSIHVGEWSNNKLSGMGTKVDRQGNILFSGRVNNGKKDGIGIRYCTNKERLFVEKWEDGVFKNKVSEFDKCGNLIYTGEIKDGKRNGYGTEYNKKGEMIYEGEWYDDTYTGKGKFHLKNGNKLYGNFLKGNFTGFGCEFDSVGHKIYEGYWEDNLYNGEGKRFFENGAFFKGTFKSGKLIEECKAYDSAGELIYVGECEDYKFSGKGCYYKYGEKVYEGEFLNNMYNGFGEQYRKGKCLYSGQFRDNKRNGIGTLYIFGNVKYVGQWKDNYYDGCGILYDGGKIKYVGQFMCGLKHGRINEIKDDYLYRECMFEDNRMIYVNEYDVLNKSLVYVGNIKDDKPGGMGCTFNEYSEKVDEGIFVDGKIEKRMEVKLLSMEHLPKCDDLVDTDYEKFTQKYHFVTQKKFIGGIYSGQIYYDIPNGKGTILYKDHRYTGYFKNCRPMGKGIIYVEDGSKIEGEFSDKETTKTETLEFENKVKYYLIRQD